MTTLRSAIADDLDKRAQEFMSRHEVTYIQALRAVLPPEGNHMSKYTTATAGAEVHSRAEQYAAAHNCTYREGVIATLASDKQLADAYSAPAPRRRVSTMATVDPRSQPAVPVTADDEAEITDWITRAVRDGKAGLLPGALGDLAVEADKFAKIGMPLEEATRRAMGTFPNLLALAKILLTDIRRNAPEKPVAQQEQGNPTGYEVHARAVKLQQKYPHMDYREAVGAALSEDPALKQRYAGMQR
jgi:hypothetical protein